MDRELLDFAVGLAERAGELAAERFYSADFSIAVKEDRTEVTDADLAVEELIRSTLARYCPDDGVFGEELGEETGSSGRRWIIDPIDGTTLFAHRVPLFAVNLALEDEIGSAIGVTHRPIARQTVYAGRGLGCRVRAGASEIAPVLRQAPSLKGSRVEMVNSGFWPVELVVRLHEASRSMGGDTFGIGGLLTGTIDAIVVAGSEMGYEDLAPYPVILAEAGAVGTDLHGGSLLSDKPYTAVLSTGQFHDELLSLLSGNASEDMAVVGPA
jgi:histidinol-phosphatase